MRQPHESSESCQLPIALLRKYILPRDRLGSARVVADATGDVKEESDFLPYGEERVIANDEQTPDNAYKFTGHERDTDAERVQDHTLYRQYTPSLARWHSPDPLRGSPANPQSWNRYSYAGNSPCNYVDPNGATPESGIHHVDPFRFFFEARAEYFHRFVDEDWIDDQFSPDMVKRKWDSLSEGCKRGLTDAMQQGDADDETAMLLRIQALDRAQDPGVLRTAAARAGLDFSEGGRMLAAIGIRESLFGELMVQSGGGGRGVFGIDITRNTEVTEEQAMDYHFALNWAARRLADNYFSLSQQYDFDHAHLLQATAAAYNFGLGNIRGNPETIDVGSWDSRGTIEEGFTGNYGSNILDLMECFDGW